MGTRSDIVVCMKNRIYEQLSYESQQFLYRFGNREDTESEGVAYTFDDIKWYRNTDEEIARLYSDLMWSGDGAAADDVDDYLILEACQEYPSHESPGDEGAWYDNPWGFRKQISITIEREN